MDVLQNVSKGMHKDNEISLQPKDTYRDAKNGYLISGNGQFYTFVTAKGNKLSIEIPTSPTNSIQRIVIGWVSSRDFLYLFATTDQTDAGGYGEILKVTLNETTNLGTTQIIYSSNSLNFSTKYPIGEQAVFIPESDSVGRIYWTDNFNSPRVINVLDPNVSTINPDLLNITPGMLAAEVNFEGTEKTLDATLVSGQLKSGLYRYTYRLSSVTIGAQTNWFPLTNGISIGPEYAVIFPAEYSTYIKYSNYDGGDTDEITKKGVRISITGLDTKYDQIEVATFFYNGVDSNPDGSIISIEDIISTSYKFTHTGGVNLGTVTPAEVLITTSDIKKAKAIATNKNRLMLGNITENPELELKDIADNITSETFVYTYLTDDADFPNVDNSSPTQRASSFSPQSLVGTESPNSPCGLFGHTASLSYGIASGKIRHGQWYGIYKSGSTITYMGVSYTYGQYFIGRQGNTTYTVTTGTVSKPVIAYIRIKKFKNSLGDEYYNNIAISDEFTDNKGPLFNNYVQGYWRGETYRFALIVWDSQMRPTFAQWITDKQMPQVYEDIDIQDPFIDSSAGLKGRTQEGAYLRALGLRFNNIDLEKLVTSLDISLAELPNYISGFSIVRAERDPNIIAQGLVLPVAKAGDGVASTTSRFYKRWFPFNWWQLHTYPTGSPSINWDDEMIIDREYGKFISPEDLFDYKGNFDPGSEVQATHIKILGKAYNFTSWSSSPGNDIANMRFFTGAIIAGASDYQFGMSRYIQRADFNNGTEVNLKSIYHIGSVANTAFTWDPDNPAREFVNILTFNKSNASTLNSTTASNQTFNYGSRGAILNLGSLLPKLVSNAPSYADTKGGINKGYAYYVNLINNNPDPYGGTSDSAKSHTTYMGTGHFQPINATVYAENNNSWKFDEVEVFGGDCYLNLFDVNTEIINTSNINVTTKRTDLYGFTDIFPVESNINIGLRQGRHVNKDGIMSGLWIGGSAPYTFLLAKDDSTNEVNNNGVCDTELEAFVYNEAYSQVPNILYPATPLNFNTKQKYENRVRYSELKTSNEPSDSFRQFLINNFRDVDIQNRGVNNLKVRGENLFYWQDKAVGYLPINERITVASALGAPTEIGVGGVMTRYDERTDFYGNQHTHGLVENPEGFVWIDRKNRALLNMNLGGQVAELSIMKGMMSFLDPLIKQSTLDNTIDKFTNGFTGIYDARTKNTYITFVGVSSETVEGTVTLISSDKIVINLGSYSDLTDYLPLFADQSDGDTLNIIYDGINYQATLFGVITPLFGSTVYASVNLTITGIAVNDSISLTLFGPFESKTLALNHISGSFVSIYSFEPSLYIRHNDLMFTIPNNLQGTENKIYIHDEGDLCKFYDTVFDTDVTLIVNPNVDIPKVFDNIQTNIGVDGPSSIEYSTSFQSATDLDIANNKEYKFRNRDWIGTVARENTSRMRDHYLQIKFVKDNKLNGSSTTSSNKEIKLLSLKTTLRPTF